jgi:hypothetical protein
MNWGGIKMLYMFVARFSLIMRDMESYICSVHVKGDS